MPRKLTEGEANTIIGGTIPTHLQTDTKLTRSDTSVANPEPGYTDRSPGHKSGTGGAADHRNFTRGRAFQKLAIHIGHIKPTSWSTIIGLLMTPVM